MHPLYQHSVTAVLGRLKTKALIHLSGSADVLPSQRAFFAEVFRHWKGNAVAGRLYYNLLDCYRIEPTEFPAKVPFKQVEKLLKSLNRSEFFDRIFAEGRVHGIAGTPELGCLVLGHAQPNGTPGYYAAVYGDDDPDRCIYCSLVPASSDSEGRISVFATDGWRDISPQDVSACMPARLMVTALSNHLQKVDQSPIPLIGFETTGKEKPPEDVEFGRRIKEIARRRMSVTTGTTSLGNITPHDLEFCLEFGADRVGTLVARIRCGYRPRMAVYWNGQTFVMSDDYPFYIAYRRASCEEAAVSILGSFPPDRVQAEQTGGVDLLPPPAVASADVNPAPVTPEFAAWRLEEGLRGKRALPSRLIAVWMTFADLLDDNSADEKTIHKFILKNPEVLTVYGTRFESEVRLGDNYRIDLIVHSSDVKNRVMLVELEHHRHGLFTADGQPRAEITHAIQQVQDWFRWIRENPNDPVAQVSGALPPSGLVVAGRSRAFPEDMRDRLAHLNVGSAVRVITYDELLDALADVIFSRLDD